MERAKKYNERIAREREKERKEQIAKEKKIEKQQIKEQKQNLIKANKNEERQIKLDIQRMSEEDKLSKIQQLSSLQPAASSLVGRQPEKKGRGRPRKQSAPVESATMTKGSTKKGGVIMDV